jgi:hypothetical protein
MSTRSPGSPGFGESTAVSGLAEGGPNIFNKSLMSRLVSTHARTALR